MKKAKVGDTLYWYSPNENKVLSGKVIRVDKNEYIIDSKNTDGTMWTIRDYRTSKRKNIEYLKKLLYYA